MVEVESGRPVEQPLRVVESRRPCPHCPTTRSAPWWVRAGDGDEAAKSELFAALYADLHRLARAQLRGSGGQLTVGATTLLHEAYLDIAKRDAVAFPDRNRFF